MATWKIYNATGSPLVDGQAILVKWPDRLPGGGPRIPDSGLVVPPIAASSGGTTQVNVDLGGTGFRAVVLDGDWSNLDSKLSAPAVCGIYSGLAKAVVLAGELAYEGIPGSVYYASATAGGIATVPPPPVTEADPADEQWIRVLGVQISEATMLVRPDVIPVRPLPVAMCQGTTNFNYRLARFGNF